MKYRFRAADDGALVLQVQIPGSVYGYDREPKWRDATVSDIPVNDPFRREQPERYREAGSIDERGHLHFFGDKD